MGRLDDIIARNRAAGAVGDDVKPEVDAKAPSAPELTTFDVFRQQKILLLIPLLVICIVIVGFLAQGAFDDDDDDDAATGVTEGNCADLKLRFAAVETALQELTRPSALGVDIYCEKLAGIVEATSQRADDYKLMLSFADDLERASKQCASAGVETTRGSLIGKLASTRKNHHCLR